MILEEGEGSKRYCIKRKHVAIICAVVVGVGLIVGLSVGLTRSCDSTDGGQGTTQAPSHRPPTSRPPTSRPPTLSPPQDQGVCPASEDESGGWKDFRLPDFINPVHYDLEVKPLLEEDTYTGSVNISINVSSPTRNLWLHLRETRITQLPVLRKPSGEQVKVRRCFEYKKQEYVVVETEEELAPNGGKGLYQLTMEFAGWLNGSLVGFYRTTYVEKGQIKSIAATDHEPTDARKSFPCFDEPNKKATYTISIVHPKEYKALSNMPVEKEESVDDKWNRTTFQKSVPMSTYLVCFAVHQFDSIMRISNRGIPRDQMLLEDVLPVQEDDSLISSHPIIVTVTSPDEITSVFDGISYSKGASILRMLEDWITPEKFQKGCQSYLQKYKFKNAKTSDFWAALEEASHLPVKEVMDTWTNQMGYPVLNVEDMRNITQKRFLLDSRVNSSEPHSILGYTWNIPVKWTEDNESRITFYNRSETRGITLNSPKPSGNTFLKINPDHIGFYRVNYEVSTWEWIATNLSLNHKYFSSADRASLIDDAFALARAQLLNYKEALNLTKYLKMEEEFLPWQRVISAVTYIISMFEDDKELYPMIEKYFRDQVKPIADSLGWNDTGDHLTKLLRASVLGLACKMGDSDALNNASQLFQAWLTGTVSLPVNLRLLVYRYGMQNSGNETSWNYTLQQYQKTSLAQEKEKLLYGLASVKNVTILSRYLDLLKDSNLIKTQDVFTVIRYISYNSYGKTMAWNWIQLNWEYLVNRYTLNDRNLGRIVTIAEPFNTELQLWQMESFFKRYPEAGAGEKRRQQVLETVKNNIEWLKQNRDTIRDWFFDLNG
ncbi:glutamyl aminopeptidase isoform X2 [Phocoena sinus]|uniref:glutamyl aminopeptidase isoform X2 n=1 Tax=Phocoena sinus TaxID=42100 RepID=UPI0013C4CCC9|nr:glutamyl aminopeptidase isoform X2 [Phocoena sinus]